MVVKGIEAAQKDLAIEKERMLQEEVLLILKLYQLQMYICEHVTYVMMFY